MNNFSKFFLLLLTLSFSGQVMAVVNCTTGGFASDVIELNGTATVNEDGSLTCEVEYKDAPMRYRSYAVDFIVTDLDRKLGGDEPSSFRIEGSTNEKIKYLKKQSYRWTLEDTVNNIIISTVSCNLPQSNPSSWERAEYKLGRILNDIEKAKKKDSSIEIECVSYVSAI